MHVIDGKWQNGVGKMFTSMKIEALAQRAPENIRSPGWWPHLRYLESAKAVARLPLSQLVCCQWNRGSTVALAGFTWVLYFFFLYIIHHIESLGWWIYFWLASWQAMTQASGFQPQQMIFAKAGGKLKKEKRWLVVSPMRVNNFVINHLCVLLKYVFFNLTFNPPTFIFHFNPLCTASSEWDWQKIALLFSILWCLLASACCKIYNEHLATAT